jgi:hypothetical protein
MAMPFNGMMPLWNYRKQLERSRLLLLTFQQFGPAVDPPRARHMEGSVMIHAISIHHRSPEHSRLPSWSPHPSQGTGWDASISHFFSGQRQPAQVSYIGICRGGPRDGRRMAELSKEKKILFREGLPTSDDDIAAKHQGAYRYLDGAWLWELLA